MSVSDAGKYQVFQFTVQAASIAEDTIFTTASLAYHQVGTAGFIVNVCVQELIAVITCVSQVEA
jgi:hypothetical protein